MFGIWQIFGPPNRHRCRKKIIDRSVPIDADRTQRAEVGELGQNVDFYAKKLKRNGSEFMLGLLRRALAGELCCGEENVIYCK